MIRIRKITSRVLAAEAAERWAEAYPDGSAWGDDKPRILKALRDLGEKPTPATVNAVIGNTSWTQIPACGCCGQSNLRSVIRFGEDDGDYDNRPTHLCAQCVSDAARLIRR